MGLQALPLPNFLTQRIVGDIMLDFFIVQIHPDLNYSLSSALFEERSGFCKALGDFGFHADGGELDIVFFQTFKHHRIRSPFFSSAEPSCHLGC
ncbi:MAG: hypothetical protein SFY81_16385 [Verrucomicrobiota bacterium]|nr:hypothetical protein [Verrucomicrobiota bacterium]